MTSNKRSKNATLIFLENINLINTLIVLLLQMQSWCYRPWCSCCHEICARIGLCTLRWNFSAKSLSLHFFNRIFLRRIINWIWIGINYAPTYSPNASPNIPLPNNKKNRMWMTTAMLTSLTLFSAIYNLYRTTANASDFFDVFRGLKLKAWNWCEFEPINACYQIIWFLFIKNSWKSTSFLASQNNF